VGRKRDGSRYAGDVGTDLGSADAVLEGKALWKRSAYRTTAGRSKGTPARAPARTSDLARSRGRAQATDRSPEASPDCTTGAMGCRAPGRTAQACKGLYRSDWLCPSRGFQGFFRMIGLGGSIRPTTPTGALHPSRPPSRLAGLPGSPGSTRPSPQASVLSG